MCGLHAPADRTPFFSFKCTPLYQTVTELPMAKLKPTHLELTFDLSGHWLQQEKQVYSYQSRASLWLIFHVVTNILNGTSRIRSAIHQHIIMWLPAVIARGRLQGSNYIISAIRRKLTHKERFPQCFWIESIVAQRVQPVLRDVCVHVTLRAYELAFLVGKHSPSLDHMAY